jgi:hypothetical protein
MKKIKGTFTAEDGTQYTGELSYEDTSYKRPRREDRERYYYFDSIGVISNDNEYHDDIDNYRYSVGNYFLTKEEAIKHLELTQARVRIEDAVREYNGNWKADWTNINQEKNKIFFNWGVDTFDFNTYVECQTPNGFYLKDKNKGFLKKHEADLKLIMGITN